MFASVTNDANPIHVDGAAAAAAGFAGGAVVHGMLVASMFGGVIGTRFPGAVYASQTLTFRAPVTVGERVLAEVEVTRVGESRVAFATRVRKEGEGGELAVDGTAMAFMRDAGARGGE
jgi:acyl dehydratase